MGGGRIPGTNGYLCGGHMAATTPAGPADASSTSAHGADLDEAPAGGGVPVVSGSSALFSPLQAVQLPQPLTPETLAGAYHRLPVRYRDPRSGAVVTLVCSPSIYVNVMLARRVPNPGALGALNEAASRFGRGRRAVLALAPDGRPRIRRACRGHGRPDDLAYTLSLALSCGLVTPTGVRPYCEDLTVCGLGLDCVGFVQSYFQLRHGFVPPSAIPNYRVPARQRWNVAEILPDDVLVFDSDDGPVPHIAVVAKPAPGFANRFLIGESTGSFGGPPGGYGGTGGVSISTYEFGDPNAAGSFSIRRNLEGRVQNKAASVFRVEQAGAAEAG